MLVLFMVYMFAGGCGAQALELQADAQVFGQGLEQPLSEDAACGRVQAVEEAGGDVKAAKGADGAGSATCFVYICGAVKRPGVYEMPIGSRVYEVVERAGGLADGAVLGAVNQAEPVTDGQMIEIPDAAEQKEEAEDAAASADGLININTATVAQLMSLNGIGEAKAQGIVAYRETNGRFASVEELKNVSGIGESIFEKLKDRITV